MKLGQRQGDLIVIEQGLKPGERVVINGQIGVMPGGKVRVVTDAPSGAGASGGNRESFRTIYSPAGHDRGPDHLGHCFRRAQLTSVFR